MKLRSLETINSKERISSLDIFRSIAIIAVVVYHFNNLLPYGFLGVDLFFLISGFLIGGILIKDIEAGKKINFFKFFSQRAFKILPSFYAYLLFGSLIAILLYSSTNPDQIIPLWDLPRYIFFYQNYTGVPFHQAFDGVWSLCVEEHFYILLPILFLLIQHFVSDRYRKATLFTFTILMICSGIIFKPLSYYFTQGQDTYSATHNRIDALAWGILLSLIVTYYNKKILSFNFKWITFSLGLLLLVLSIFASAWYKNVLFDKIYFHSIIPIAFFFMMLGAYYVDFSRLKSLRFIAYYSYNWYLWHPIFIIFITKHVGFNVLGFAIYLVSSFLLSVLATITIEEYFLKKRKAVLSKIFKH